MRKHVFFHLLQQKISVLSLAFLLAGPMAFAQEKTHTIANGETLSSIARKYKTTISELQKLNPDAKKGLKAGAELKLPGKTEKAVKEPVTADAVAAKETEGKKHEVKSGESLFKIAKKYNVSVKELESWNGIKNSDLKAGQELVVSAPGSAPSIPQPKLKEKAEPEMAGVQEKTDVHVVAKGQTLSTIARVHGTSVAEIKKLNNLKSDNVNLGQELVIPAKKDAGDKPKPETKKETQPEPEKPTLTEQKQKLVPDAPKEKAQGPVKETVKSESPAETPVQEKEEVKMTNGIREVSNALGYTRIVETGFAEAIEGEGNSKKHLCLHKSAPVGSILQVKNETNGQSVFVKVIGKLPETGSNEKLIIRISRQAYDRLLAVGKRFPVEVSYPQAQP